MSNNKYYFAIFGNPIAHSMSPIIHKEFAKQENIQIDFDKILVTDKRFFQQEVDNFTKNDGIGANITVPLKVEAFNLFKEKTNRAKIAMSVNTIFKLEKDSTNWCADNTDGEGLILDLMRLNTNISNSKVLIIGAGGSARGIINPILEKNPKGLFITNRSMEKALLLSKIFDINPIKFNNLGSYSYDIIINCTSSSLFNSQLDVDNNIFSNVTLAYDLFYSKDKTTFLLQAQRYGAKNLADGLGMLIFQAAQCYKLWRNFSPIVEPIIKKLRNLI